MKLTVIIATRNSLSTLKPCLESLSNIVDPGGDVNYLAIDGASTDGTVELIRDNYPKIKLETQNGRGLFPALNEGGERATGDYAMFLHSDDEIGKLDMSKIEIDRNTVVYGMVEFIDDDGNVLFRRRPPLFPKQCLSQYPFIFHPNAIYPRWLLLKYPFDGDRYGAAADMWQVNAFRDEVKFVPTKAITYRFRNHKQSNTVKHLKRPNLVFCFQ